MRREPRSSVEEPVETAAEPEPALSLAEVVVRRRRLELARIHVTQQLELARAEAHRQMLQRALSALDQELERLI
jgi:hypothetical protein